jgi:hypothetical protein
LVLTKGYILKYKEMSILKWFHPGRQDSVCRPGILSFVLAAMSGFFLLSATDSLAQGNLLITPRRVVFEGSKRSFDLNLANSGKDTATYAVSLIQIRMTEDGAFQQITEPDQGQQFADRFIRYFPRTVTLGPGESQAVKIQLIRSNELKPGEYRSHFYFRSEKKATPLGEAGNAERDTSSFSVRITPIFGITIPVIIQNGLSDMKVNLSDLGFSFVNDTLPQLKFVFRRSGNMSVYGNITVDHISSLGKVIRVGIANGVAVYTPNTIRRFALNLIVPAGTDLKSGKLRVTYSAPSDLKAEKYAEADLVMQK